MPKAPAMLVALTRLCCIEINARGEACVTGTRERIGTEVSRMLRRLLKYVSSSVTSAQGNPLRIVLVEEFIVCRWSPCCCIGCWFVALRWLRCVVVENRSRGMRVSDLVTCLIVMWLAGAEFM